MNYTPKQVKFLQFVTKFTEKNGYAPTLDEIGADFGISRPTVYEARLALERKGAVRSRRYEARSIEVLDPRFGGPNLDEFPDGTRKQVLSALSSAFDALEECRFQSVITHLLHAMDLVTG